MTIKGLDRWIEREQEEAPCDVCGNMVDDCICPECPTCKTQGDPHCYAVHGLVRTEEQLAGRKEMDRKLEQERREEEKWIKAGVYEDGTGSWTDLNPVRRGQ